MTLASILILTGIACLAVGLCLPLVYGVRMRLASRRNGLPARTRLVGATGVFSGMGPR